MSGLRRVAAGGQSDVKVYNVAGGKSLPTWLSEKKKASLRKDEEFRRRVELIQARRRQPPLAGAARSRSRDQELDFPVSSSRVKLSSDGNFLVVTGIHPPQVRPQPPTRHGSLPSHHRSALSRVAVARCR